MSAVIIISTLTFIIYLLTRRLLITVIKDEHWRVEIYFTLGAVRIRRSATKSNKGKNSETERKKAGLHHYRMIFRRLTKILARSEIHIKKLHIPYALQDELPSEDATRSWRYHGTILALLTFLKANTQRLVIDDNAIILNSDKQKLSVDVTVKVRLFRILGAIAVFILGKNVIKRKRAA